MYDVLCSGWLSFQVATTAGAKLGESQEPRAAKFGSVTQMAGQCCQISGKLDFKNFSSAYSLNTYYAASSILNTLDALGHVR